MAHHYCEGNELLEMQEDVDRCWLRIRELEAELAKSQEEVHVLKQAEEQSTLRAQSAEAERWELLWKSEQKRGELQGALLHVETERDEAVRLLRILRRFAAESGSSPIATDAFLSRIDARKRDGNG